MRGRRGGGESHWLSTLGGKQLFIVCVLEYRGGGESHWGRTFGVGKHWVGAEVGAVHIGRGVGSLWGDKNTDLGEITLGATL